MAARQWGRAAAAALLLLCSIPSVTAADGWTVTPDISLTGTYNDNATLAASGSERSDFITQVSPGLRIDGRGPRVRGTFDYRPSLLLYSRNSEEDRLVNRLNAAGSLEAVEDFFFVDLDGSITQNFISPFGARPADIAIITPNRAEARSFGISPYIRGVLGQGYNYEVRNRNVWTSSDENALANVHSTLWNGRLASPVRLFGWALEYEDSKIRQEEFSVQPDRESRLARARLFFQPDYAWRLSLSAGREENNYQTFDETRSNTMHGAGVTWTPSARTTGDLQYERRFFGPSRSARLQHRTRLTAWNISYSRNTSDFQQELLRLPPGNTLALVDAIFAARIPDPLERRDAVLQFFRASGTPLFLASSLAFYTQQIMLQERLEASAGIIGVRNSITFSAFASDSTRLSEGLTGIVPDSFLLSDRIKQQGFGIRADHKLTPFTSAGASLTRTYSEQLEPSVLESWNDAVSLTLNHTLSPKTTSFAGVSFTGVKNEGLGVTDQKARSAFVGLTHRF
jgi:uncharacterized protein (PEP-CTERM system associated)